MNTLKTFNRFKIFGAILISYGMVTFGSPHVFVANSTQIKPEFIAGLRASPQTMYAFVKSPFNAEDRKNNVETAQIDSVDEKANLPFQLVAPGVYAAEDSQTGERYIKLSDGTKVEVRYVTFSDGRKVKVYIPVSQ